MFETRAEPIFEQRRALAEFHRVVTPEAIEQIANDLMRNADSPTLRKLISLMGVFSNVTGEQENELDHFFGGSIRRRDTEFMRMVADIMHDPDSQRHNARFAQKLSEIAQGTAPRSLHPVR